MPSWFAELLDIANQTLTAAVVVITVSLLLYNLSRNFHNRVTRSASILLGCVTLTYALDALLALEGQAPGPLIFRRAQWIGIAFTPAALFHLADALLTTTGLPSRGRRLLLLRLWYLTSALFACLAVFTDQLVHDVDQLLRAQPTLFSLFTLYFLLISAFAFLLVQRARLRCLTQGTSRRMAMLQFSLPTASIAIFPYSALLSPGEEFSSLLLILVSLANATVIILIIFLYYPLSYFGTEKPDRVVKQELLNFSLRGPAMGLLALGIMSAFAALPHVMGIQGVAFIPFAVVVGILLWQWIAHLALPWLGKVLIYDAEGAAQLARLEELNDRLLAKRDLLHLLEAVLATICDSLRAGGAAVHQIQDPGSEGVAMAGRLADDWSAVKPPPFPAAAAPNDPLRHEDAWWLPLRSSYQRDSAGNPHVIGALRILADADTFPLSQRAALDFRILRQRAERALSDMKLQEEMQAVLEGFLPQIALTGARAVEAAYPISREGAAATQLPDRAQVITQVRAALRHYWGGRGLYQNALQELAVVRDRLNSRDYNPARALREVLKTAIEQQRPAGEPQFTAPEWTLYNILDLRFVQRCKVREVARKLALSEPDLYRKQRIAIEVVADELLNMEKRSLAGESS
ncbi:MAG: hypothetical protein OXF83_04000 [Anaerolineaceae bacterium]|nr:hypothetical protein [Anaerolineaceae bacterium]